jgi:hypothetical protein
VLGNRVLGRIYGPKRDEVTGERRKLLTEELHNLYSFPNIITFFYLNLSHYRHASDKGERKYSCYSFLISALGGVSGQRHAQAALYPRGKDPEGAGWASDLVWTQRLEEKSVASDGNRTSVVYSVVRHCTD